VITVTNHANLSSTEYIDVLVDESPPETGVIYEGWHDLNLFTINFHVERSNK